MLIRSLKNNVVKKDACKAKIKNVEEKIPYSAALAAKTSLNV